MVCKNRFNCFTSTNILPNIYIYNLKNKNQQFNALLIGILFSFGMQAWVYYLWNMNEKMAKR